MDNFMQEAAINASKYVEELIKGALERGDLVQVVRCGKCRKIMTEACHLCSFDVDGYCTGGPNDDFYCADGERREQEVVR